MNNRYRHRFEATQANIETARREARGLWCLVATYKAGSSAKAAAKNFKARYYPDDPVEFEYRSIDNEPGLWARWPAGE